MFHNVIGLGGYAQVGKDAFANVLERHYGWYHTYMSSALREALEVLNPIIYTTYDGGEFKTLRFKDVVDMYGYETAKEISEVRKLLQRMGTEVARNLWGENFWIERTSADLKKHINDGHAVVLTGIRYFNEIEMIKDFGGSLIWVSRPGYSAINDHSSDNSLIEEDFSFTFDNNKRLEDLDVTVPEFMKNIGYLR